MSERKPTETLWNHNCPSCATLRAQLAEAKKERERRDHVFEALRDRVAELKDRLAEAQKRIGELVEDKNRAGERDAREE